MCLYGKKEEEKKTFFDSLYLYRHPLRLAPSQMRASRGRAHAQAEQRTPQRESAESSRQQQPQAEQRSSIAHKKYVK
jgi:hypothetical protein